MRSSPAQIAFLTVGGRPARARHLTEAPAGVGASPYAAPMPCLVLRCSDPTAHVETRQVDDLRVDIPFCAAHWTRVQDGERWQTDYQHGQQAMVVLMGDDLPPLYEKFDIRQPHAGDRTYVQARLVLSDGDSVTFAIPEDKVAGAANLLTFFTRGQGE